MYFQLLKSARSNTMLNKKYSKLHLALFLVRKVPETSCCCSIRRQVCSSFDESGNSKPVQDKWFMRVVQVHIELQAKLKLKAVEGVTSSQR
jgi:hypothetical protein